MSKYFRRCITVAALICIIFMWPMSENVYGASGSSFTNAVTLTANRATNGTISDGSSFYYKFTKDSGYCKLIISSQQGSKTVALYDRYRNLIGFCGSSSSSASDTGTAEYYLLGGTYYVEVYGADGGYTIAYYWTNSNETVAETQTKKHDTAVDAAKISLNKLSVGQLGYDDYSDAFWFEAPHDGTISVSKFFSSGDESIIKGQFLNSSGREEGAEFSTLDGPDNVYSIPISKGEHFVVFYEGEGKYYYNLEYSVPESEHVYGEWSVIQNASCDQEGLKQKTCSVCGATQTETIPPSHNFGSWEITKASTCTEAGTKKRTCSLCQTVETETIPAEHIWNTEYTIDKAATQTTTGSKSIHCSVCGIIKEGSSEVIPTLTPSTPTATPTAASEIIDLPSVKISKPKAAKKSATIKWKKVSKKNQKKIAKIQIQYSMDKYFKTDVKTVTAKKSATSKKIKKLESKKIYYVRIRAYKNSGGKVHVSNWSAVKKVKAK